jgi:hypothetical protein
MSDNNRDPAAIKAAADPENKKTAFLSRIVGSIGNLNENIASGAEGLLRSTANLANNQDLIQAKRYIAKMGTDITGIDGVGGFAGEGGTLDISGRVAGTLNKALLDASRSFGRLSIHSGATATQNGLIRGPLGNSALGNLSARMLNTVWPGSANKINGTIQNLHLEKLARAPGMLMASIDNLITAVDNVLAIPVAFVASLYYGAISIVKRIAKEINEILDILMKFVFSFLDELIPLTEILQFLSDISILSSQIGGIAGTFLGANAISGITNQIQTFTNDIFSIVQNPLDLVFAYAPPEVSQILYAINNPQTLLNRVLPPQLSEAFSTISRMTGYGFNGNMGYGFESVLQGLQGGVLRSLISNYSAQYGILGPLLQGGANFNTGGGNQPTLLAGRYDTGINDKTILRASPYVDKSGP